MRQLRYDIIKFKHAACHLTFFKIEYVDSIHNALFTDKLIPEGIFDIKERRMWAISPARNFTVLTTDHFFNDMPI